jgi:hypothetical protein
MRKLSIIAAAAAAAIAVSAAAPASAASATPRYTFQLATDCPGPPADFGRGVRLGPIVDGFQTIVLSTKHKLPLKWNTIQDPSENANHNGTFTLSYGRKYLRINSVHAWLGSRKQVYSITDGYGDGACGGPRPIHLGDYVEGQPTNVWTARRKVLRSEPEVTNCGQDCYLATDLHQTWDSTRA